jgi:tetratricopeptide (TPR) repeat protein
MQREDLLRVSELYAENHFHECFKAALKALSRDPGNLSEELMLLSSMAQTQGFSEFMTELDFDSPHFNQFWQFRHFKSRIYILMGHYQKSSAGALASDLQAKTEAEDGLKLKPDSVPLLEDKGLAAHLLSQDKEAIYAFDQAIQILKSSPDRKALAQAFLEKSGVEAAAGLNLAALNDIESSLAFDPDQPNVLLVKGELNARIADSMNSVRDKRNQFRQAIAASKAALNGGCTSLVALPMLAGYYQFAADTTNVESTLDRAKAQEISILESHNKLVPHHPWTPKTPPAPIMDPLHDLIQNLAVDESVPYLQQPFLISGLWEESAQLSMTHHHWRKALDDLRFYREFPGSRPVDSEIATCKQNLGLK